MVIIFYILMLIFSPQVFWSWGWFILALILQGINSLLYDAKITRTNRQAIENITDNITEFINELDDMTKEEVWEQLLEWKNDLTRTR